MAMDRITEEIAHFIGLFHLTVEDLRFRENYLDFDTVKPADEKIAELPTGYWPIDGRHRLTEFDPELDYEPIPPDIVSLTTLAEVKFAPPEIPWNEADIVIYPGFLKPASVASHASASLLLQPPEPPGSIVVVIEQRIRLKDDDYVGVGGHGLTFSPVMDFGEDLASLLAGAMRFAPLADASLPGSGEAIADFILDAPAALAGTAAVARADDNAFVLEQELIEGRFVNGRALDASEDLPKLSDHLQILGKNKEPEAEADPVSSSSQPFEQHASVTLEMGGNVLLNSAHLSNSWLGSPVIAVGGSSHEVNAIIQINVWMDQDLVSKKLGAFENAPPSSTKAFNIAEFKRTEFSVEMNDAQGSPVTWNVTRIDGDLIIMNWIKQFTFMMDNDIAIASSSGVKTFVTAGGNTAINEISIIELGLYYDLVIIGGNIYDMNFIQQKNILLDNDMIGSVAGFGTHGAGSVSTSGNLLWNHASITNIGGAARFEALPDAYSQALGNLKAGDLTVPAGLLGDAAFSGQPFLNVLYISGNLLDLQYFSQTNILGDADQVALAMNQMDAHPEADWTISTGTNALVNLASITDVDALGTTYVGNSHYSYELLIHANIVDTDPDLGGQDPDQLVNEAVAFLDDDMADGNGGGAQTGIQPYDPHEAAQADVMQTMLV